QSDFRVPGRNGSGSRRDAADDERHRQAILECQFFAKPVYAVPGDSNLAGAAKSGTARTAIAGGVGGFTVGSQHAAVAAGKGTEAVVADAGVFPVDQPASQSDEES